MGAGKSLSDREKNSREEKSASFGGMERISDTEGGFNRGEDLNQQEKKHVVNLPLIACRSW